jgi:hypothetical protein
MKYLVKFKYIDDYTNVWSYQSGSFSANNEHDAVEKCKIWYGLGIDCAYQIISVEKV